MRVTWASAFRERVFFSETGCWLWEGRTQNGYGRFGRTVSHRVTYEWLVGPVAKNIELDHLCRVRNCVNPTHLEPVTRTENGRRGQGACGKNHRKTQCPRGHKYDILLKDGRRSCRTCAREHWRNMYKRRGTEILALQKERKRKCS